MSQVLRAEADTLEWTPVRSSNIAALAYSPAFGRAFCRFKDGATYAYKIPRPVFDGWLAAPSKGQYLYYVVRAKGTDSAYEYWGPF